MHEPNHHALRLWGDGRTFQFETPARQTEIFESLIKGTSSSDSLEREWAIEALYRLLSHFPPGRQVQAVDRLIECTGCGNKACSLRALKGVQFATDYLDIRQASVLLEQLQRVRSDDWEIIRVIAIELAQSILMRWGHDRDVMMKCSVLIADLREHTSEWVDRSLTDPERTMGLARLIADGIGLRPIGVVRNGYFTLEQMTDFDYESEGEVHVWREFRRGMQGLTDLNEIVVLVYLDNQQDCPTGLVRPGAFATSGAQRHNPVFYKYAKLTGISDDVIRVKGLKALDMTLVLDIRSNRAQGPWRTQCDSQLCQEG